MAWEPISWLIFLFMDISLLCMNLYQIVCLSDLEADYLNPYESASRINNLVLKEFLLHGVFSISLLVTRHWFLFFLSLLPNYINAKKFLARQHLIDVTEVFRVIDSEKKIRVAKLAFYLIFFIIILIRSSIAGAFSTVLSALLSNSEDLDVRSSVLEF
ncbi:unnamed protein product [Cuscuta campestris]|uniref:Cornichon n=2 Tax=Cuscuta sect. Cleistogrammica TaxID=1824901 RepID=A0A484K7K7_9ASTE|nr:hypothetical protein DM860_010528 [Cuscuta australis]VFQ59307.1 unnamed protein product [Cuscuta campestris]